MTGERKVKLWLGSAGHGCRVEIDGVDISDTLRAVHVHAEVGKATRVTLQHIGASVDIAGEAAIVDGGNS